MLMGLGIMIIVFLTYKNNYNLRFLARIRKNASINLGI